MKEKKFQKNKDKKDKHGCGMTIGLSPHTFQSLLLPNLEQLSRQNLQVSAITTFHALIATKCCRHISLETCIPGSICQVPLVASLYMMISKGFRSLSGSITGN
jgi:hypothetical protein